MSEIVVRFPDHPDVPDLSTMHFGEGAWLVNIENWFDGLDARIENEARPNADGDFDSDPVYAGARFPIVTGRLRFDDTADMWAARAPFAKLMASREPFTLEVESPDGVRQATVVRNGKLGWDLSSPYRVEFELPLKASDGRKYGPVQTASTGLPVAGGGVVSPVMSPFTQLGGGNPGRVTLNNGGSTDTIPEFAVSGGGLSGGVELIRIETGERVRLEWPILDTNTVRFDFAAGQVWLDEQSPITGRLSVAQWWTLGPGESATVQFVGLGTATGTPTLTARWRDADA